MTATADGAGVPHGPRFAAGAVLARGARLVIQGGVPTPRTGLQTKWLDGVKRCYEASWDVSGGRGETIYLLSRDDVVLDQAMYPKDGPADGQSWSRLPDGSAAFTVGKATPDKENLAP